jgi:hypothetical protein
MQVKASQRKARAKQQASQRALFHRHHLLTFLSQVPKTKAFKRDTVRALVLEYQALCSKRDAAAGHDDQQRSIVVRQHQIHLDLAAMGAYVMDQRLKQLAKTGIWKNKKGART